MIPDTFDSPWVYPRETVEYVPFLEVSVDGAPVSTFQYAITRTYDRPTSWLDPVDVDGVWCFLLNGPMVGPGVREVWVKVTSSLSPEEPVILAGTVTLT